MTTIPEIEPYRFPTVEDLPANIADWTAEPARAVLIIHDMQRYFLKPFPDDVRRRLVSNCARLREHARESGMQVAYSAQPGGMSDDERGLLKDFWGRGMRVDVADRQVVEPLLPREDDWQFTKWRYSAFFRSDLLQRMRDAGRDQLVVCGVYAHVGVLMTAIDAFTNDLQTFVVADAVADFSEEYHRLAVDYASQRCAVVTTTEELVA